ncbi:MAG TPA: cytosine permease [Bryobacteraceae bacterium]|nr:cytosine permease [Bryobacteraceae bacterium]
MLPDYLAKAVPNPQGKRAPWYANTAPSYAGIFLWVAFYKTIATGTITQAGLGWCVAALVVAGLLCYFLYYHAPAALGMTTGYPLYVIGSSTFGTQGGYLMPGLLMGVLQIGWFAVATFVSADFVLKGMGIGSTPGSLPFIIAGVLWGLVFASVGAKGIQYVSKVALVLNAIPLLMLVVVLFQTAGGIGKYQVPAGQENPFGAFTTMLAIVAGFFATAGAAGADFGINARNTSDVRWGGLVGVTLAAIVAGGLPLISIAGAHGANPALAGFDYDNILQSIGGPVAAAMFFLFAIASIPATCFCIFIAGNSFSTMIPGVPRVASSMAAALVGIILAVTGIAANLISFFTIVGASFGPICGAMTADYLLSGRRWAGPREGVNLAGYLAWAIGFVVGILPFLPVPADVKPYVQPAVIYSYVTGFVVYAILAKAGLEPKVAQMANQAGGSQA